MSVLVLGPENPRSTVLFAAGSGGDPSRYRTVLEALSDAGHRVLAPHHPRFTPHSASTAELLERPRSLQDALAQHGGDDGDLPVFAVGHSIGGWAALCLAGAVPRDRGGRTLTVPTEPRVSRLVLFAPPLGWFHGPGALDAVSVPVTVFMGERDEITPPATIEILRRGCGQVDARVFARAGHFDFMDMLPPGVEPDPMLDHTVFLRELGTSTVAALSH
ncbi:alpha/beta hydrolase family protein [Rhodococcus phenolicus]|uniref:alpha/beta hydrolase family protein n=1 Tax=Rhodococcus phenolicus TaxID=263849 RepID=UPI00082A737C|nr:alpha/beta fold hydrolase [Rhodococcus phenolicus]